MTAADLDRVAPVIAVLAIAAAIAVGAVLVAPWLAMLALPLALICMLRGLRRLHRQAPPAPPSVRADARAHRRRHAAASRRARRARRRALELLFVCVAASPARAEPGDDDLDGDRDGDRTTDAGEASGAPDDTGAAVAPLPRGAPSVGEVLAAAYATAGLDRNRVPGGLRRVRLSGLVPWVAVRTGRNASWQDLDPEVDRGTTIEVRATWRLDRLVFDGRELQVTAAEVSRRRERRTLASRAIQLYFAWRRVAHHPARAERSRAELDALTDGWFSERLLRGVRGLR